jgi:hypothetical protein
MTTTAHVSRELVLPLPNARSARERSLRWRGAVCGACGTAAYTARRVGKDKKGNARLSRPATERYVLTEVHHDHGRAFEVVKDEPGEQEVRDVEFPAFGEPNCSCPGFVYEAKEKADGKHPDDADEFRDAMKCRHLDIVKAVLPHIGEGLAHHREHA